jgi:HNH endonuclease
VRTCSVDGCDRKRHAHGLCLAHYHRSRAKGGLRPDVPLNPTVEDRFWARVDKSGECWFWTGARTRYGHGQIGHGDVVVYAHRFVYELLVGPIPSGHGLHHTCRNPACVRPEHLVPMMQGAHVAEHREEISTARWPNGPIWRHGTLTGYGNHRCRCGACREAARRYRREYKTRQ